MKRPTGMTVLSLLLAWLAVGGIGNAVVWNLPEVQQLLARVSSSSRLPTVGGPLFTAICLAYGVAAAAASVAIWRMHPFAPKAYAAWCLTVLLGGLWFVQAGFESNLLVGLLFAFGTAGFAALGIPYTAEKIRAARPDVRHAA